VPGRQAYAPAIRPGGPRPATRGPWPDPTRRHAARRRRRRRGRGAPVPRDQRAPQQPGPTAARRTPPLSQPPRAPTPRREARRRRPRRAPPADGGGRRAQAGAGPRGLLRARPASETRIPFPHETAFCGGRLLWRGFGQGFGRAKKKGLGTRRGNLPGKRKPPGQGLGPRATPGLRGFDAAHPRAAPTAAPRPTRPPARLCRRRCHPVV
jgi:hypothetical protein